MNLIPSSNRILTVALLAAVLVTAGTAAAVTVSGDAPEPTNTGEQVTVSATLEDPFQDAPDQWTLRGSTELDNATWTVNVEAQGDPVDSIDAGGSSFETDLSADTGATDVTIEVTGEVPALNDFNYDDQEAENYRALVVSRVSDGTENELEVFSSHRYTEGSQNAREAIDSAIDTVGSKNDKIDQAISSYNVGNFGNAQDLAEEAEGGAESSQMLMIGAGVVVVLVLVAVGGYYVRERRKQGNKLQ